MMTMYNSNITLDITSPGGTAAYVWRANDLFDPDFQIGGKQPYNFDQWTTLYGKFTVLWSQIECWVTTTDTNRLFTVSVIPSLTSSLTTAPDTIQEMPGVKWNNFGGFQMSKTIGYVKNQRKTKTVFGVKDVLDDPDYSGTSLAVPNKTFYWILQVQSTDASINPNTMVLSFRHKYIVRWTERLNKLSS